MLAKTAGEAVEDEEKLAKLVEDLAVSVRRERQMAASALFLVAKSKPEALVGPMYMPGRLRTGSRPSSTLMLC